MVHRVIMNIVHKVNLPTANLECSRSLSGEASITFRSKTSTHSCAKARSRLRCINRKKICTSLEAILIIYLGMKLSQAMKLQTAENPRPGDSQKGSNQALSQVQAFTEESSSGSKGKQETNHLAP